MANELVLVTETALPVRRTVADGAAITKGSLLKLSGSSTVAASDGLDDLFGGVAFADKIASDGVTQLAVYLEGEFIAKASGSITFGDTVGSQTGWPNYLSSNKATTALSGSRVFGVALETVTNGQLFKFVLREHPQTSQQGG